MGNRDGEEDNAEPSVDEGRAAHAEDVRKRESKNECDSAESETQRGSDPSEVNAGLG